MMWIISFLQKRPTDKTIRISRIMFWLILILSLYYNLIYLGKGIDTTYFDFQFFGYVLSQGITLNEDQILILKHILLLVGLPPLIMGIVGKCFLKKKYVKILQILLAITLFYISGIISESPNLDIDILIGVMWIIPLIAGITGKMVTKNCLNYGEKVTKIRV